MRKVLPFLEHVTSLLVVLLLLASAAAWSGSLFGIHFAEAKTPTREGATKSSSPNKAEMSALLLNGQLLTPVDSVTWQTPAGGTVVNSAALATDVRGFAGPTPVFVHFSIEGKILAIATQENAETDDFFKRAEKGIRQRFVGLTANEASASAPDGVSGATYSSTALAANVQAASAKYAATPHTTAGSTSIDWLKTSAVALTLLFGFIVARRYRSVKWLRALLHLANVAILGYWTGQYLSLSLLRGWASQGIDPALSLPLLLILAIVLVFPFFGRRRHYCTWVCPYGSAQELASMLPLPKVRCPQPVYKWMRRVRLVFFSLLMLLLWTNLGNELGILDYEPFALFSPTAAPLAAVVLSALFLLSYCFIPHLWCRSVCPLGQLIDLSEEGTDKRKE